MSKLLIIPKTMLCTKYLFKCYVNNYSLHGIGNSGLKRGGGQYIQRPHYRVDDSNNLRFPIWGWLICGYSGLLTELSIWAEPWEVKCNNLNQSVILKLRTKGIKSSYQAIRGCGKITENITNPPSHCPPNTTLPPSLRPSNLAKSEACPWAW